MNTPNPAQVMANRTARLVREALTPVYSTSTPPAPAGGRAHTKIVEMEYPSGYRTWSAPMAEGRVNDYIDSFGDLAMLSDIDCSFTCWCVKDGSYYA